MPCLIMESHPSISHGTPDANISLKDSSFSLCLIGSISSEVNVLVHVQDALAISCVFLDHIVVQFHNFGYAAYLKW